MHEAMPPTKAASPLGERSPRAMGASSRRTLNVLLATIIVFTFWLSHSYSTNTQTGDASRASPKIKGQGIPRSGPILAQAKARKLNEKYLPLVAAHNPMGTSRYSVSPHDKTGAMSKYNATIVLGRLDSEPERVQWVYDELLNIQDVQIYIVDDPNSHLPHLEKNHGREAAVYLSYIIDHYDHLNDITFFWHSDKRVWHNNLLLKWDSVQTINRMDRDNIMRQGYVPSRCDLWPGCPEWIKFNPSTAEHRIDPHRLDEMFDPELFKRLFPDEESFPPFFAGTCCSQFAVSRNTIRSNPIETYQRLLKWVLEYQHDDHSGMVFEYTWPYIFLRRGRLCPSMEECYCKTYNFCLQDPKDVKDLDRWNAHRTRREEVKWQVALVENTLETRRKEAYEKGLSQGELASIIETLKPEADRLNNELERLTNVTWSFREDIIHRWRLGVPPVGW